MSGYDSCVPIQGHLAEPIMLEEVEAFIRSRTSRTDEEWVHLGLMSDAEFTADMKTRIGINVKL